MKTMTNLTACSLAVALLCATAELTRAEEEGLILSYDFARAEKGVDTVKDLSPKRRDGTLEGGAQIAEEESGKVLALDGQSGLVSIPGLANLQIKDGLTISAVVRFDDLGPAPDCADMILFKPDCFLFGRTPDGQLYFNIYSDATAEWNNGFNSAIEMPTEEYVHVAVTVERADDGAGFKGYRALGWLNGRIVGRANLNGVDFPLNDRAVDIGKGWGGPWFFKGRMKSIKVYDRALPEAEIRALAEARP